MARCHETAILISKNVHIGTSNSVLHKVAPTVTYPTFCSALRSPPRTTGYVGSKLLMNSAGMSLICTRTYRPGRKPSNLIRASSLRPSNSARFNCNYPAEPISNHNILTTKWSIKSYIERTRVNRFVPKQVIYKVSAIFWSERYQSAVINIPLKITQRWKMAMCLLGGLQRFARDNATLNINLFYNNNNNSVCYYGYDDPVRNKWHDRCV